MLEDLLALAIQEGRRGEEIDRGKHTVARLEEAGGKTRDDRLRDDQSGAKNSKRRLDAERNWAGDNGAR